MKALKNQAVSQSLMSLQEAARVLDLHELEVLRLARSGALPGTSMMGSWLFPQPMIEKWRQDRERNKSRLQSQRQLAVQKMQGLARARTLESSTTSYDLSLIEELDLKDVFAK